MDEVKAIMEDFVDETKLQPFINSASRIVTSLLSSAYGVDVLKDIELWLSAHLASSTLYRQVVTEKMFDSSVRFSEIRGQGLDSTNYGQQVKLLDSKGILGNLSKKQIIFQSMNY
jgi:hypothetical protein